MPFTFGRCAAENDWLLFCALAIASGMPVAMVTMPLICQPPRKRSTGRARCEPNVRTAAERQIVNIAQDQPTADVLRRHRAAGAAVVDVLVRGRGARNATVWEVSSISLPPVNDASRVSPWE